MGIFIDKRLDERYRGICQAMQYHQSIILRKLANDRNEEVAFGRFLNNKYVTPRQMIEATCERTANVNEGRNVLLIQDTSTMGFGMHCKINGLGRIGDGKAYGFFLHPVISVDADTGHCLGLASASHYDRKERQVDVAQRKRDRVRETLKQKESFRWYQEIERALKYGRRANNYTVVADREADIYELLVLLTALDVDFVIRSSSNRLVNDDSGNKLVDVLASSPEKGAYELALPATDKRSAHTAQLEVKWVNSHLARPRSGTGTKHLVAQQEVTVIEVKEKQSSVVGKEKPINWRLLSSHPVNSMEDALRIIGYYVNRWIIEQVFRALKRKGFDMYTTQVQNAHAVKNLTALCLINALQVMQLVQAREQPQGLDIEDGFDEVDVCVIQGLNQKLEGNTEKLKNPHPPHSMAFAAWVVARLGGWSGYTSQRPPGPKTMWDGLRRLKNMVEGVRMLDLMKLE